MHETKKIIRFHQQALSEHTLFSLLEGVRTVGPLAGLVRGCALWPMVFQDVLRLNLARVEGTAFEVHARRHLAEDAGHDAWFLGDLQAFGVAEPSLGELFSEEFQPLRDACYALVAEALAPASGAVRVAFLLSVEAAGHVFFEAMSAAVERVCPELPLRYFARSHLGVEKAHDLFSEDTTLDIDALVLTAAERECAEAMVSRVTGTFARLFTHYAEQARKGWPRHSFFQAPGGTTAAGVAYGARGSG